MDPQLLDILWEVHRETGRKGPITIVSGYRSPQTNSMLRARSRGVAQYSQHTHGKAIDFYIPGADLAQMRAVGLRLQRGGVGFYPTSGAPFIHVDTGSVRHWPRMTRDQLVKVFPDGKTVHLPTDGNPMPGYALALAEIEARGNRPGAAAIAAAGGDDDDHHAPRATRTRIPPAATVASSGTYRPDTNAVPLPQQQTVLASLTPAVQPAAKQPAIKPRTIATLDAAPVPSTRPPDLGDVTASVRGEGDRALSYAAPAERDLAGFGPIPGMHTRISELPDRSRPPQSLGVTHGLAAAAYAPATLLSLRTIAFDEDLHEPDLYSLRSLVEPARAAIHAEFAAGSVDAPPTARFAGPAVVPLQIVAFDRGAGLVTRASTN
jgi:hypothetical protein